MRLAARTDILSRYLEYHHRLVLNPEKTIDRDLPVPSQSMTLRQSKQITDSHA